MDLFWCATIRLLFLLVGAAVARRLPRPLVSHDHNLPRHSSLAASAVDFKMSSANSVVNKISKLGFPYETQDPFLFCVYHNDQVICKCRSPAREPNVCVAHLCSLLAQYPAGDAKMQAPRQGNGADFDWSQVAAYHSACLFTSCLKFVVSLTCPHRASLAVPHVPRRPNSRLPSASSPRI